MKVKRELLLAQLEAVEPGLSAREMVEQSSCFVFSDGKIITFNDELACVVASPQLAAHEFKCAVPSKPFKELLSKMVEDEIDIELEADKISVKGVGRRAEIVVEAEISLPIDSVEEPTDWRKLPDSFLDALSIVQEVASLSKDDDFYLTCVHINPNFLEACDNYQACRYNVEMDIDESCLIRRSSAKHIPALGMTHYSEGKSWLHFKNEAGLQVSVRRWGDPYADINRIFEVTGEKVTLPGGLSEAVDKAKIFSAEKAGADDIYVALKDDWMLIRGEGAYGKYEEKKKCEFKGKMAFMIPPKILLEVTKRANQCQVCSTGLRIDSGSFVYVTSLEAA